MGQDRRLDSQIGGLSGSGIGYVMAMGDEEQANRWVWTRRVTLAGAAPHAFTFASLNIPNMINALTQVHVTGVAAVTTDVANTTANGFQLLGGTAADVLDLLIIGNPANKPL